jgi:hypothetical protein
MRVLFLAMCFGFFTTASAQTINPDIFKKNIDLLYTSAAGSFKDIKNEEVGTTEDGDRKYSAGRKISGASDVYIKADAENSFTYIAHFESKDIKTAEAKIEEMMALVLGQVADKGLVRSKGTEIRYEGYRKHTVEYESDNIDLLGKYPSFSMGIIKGSSPVTIEFVINEPLWK